MNSDAMEYYNSAGERLDKSLFFVFGQARSGTTWFSRFMTHEGSFCFHELSIKCHGSSAAKDQRAKFPKFEGRDAYTKQTYRLLYLYPSFCRRMLHKLYERKGTLAVGDSDAAVFHLCLPLKQLFPSARFVGIYRNGMDQALSAAAMQGRNFETSLRRWRKAKKRLVDYVGRLGSAAMLVNMDELWEGRLDPVPIWDFLTRNQAPCDEERAIKMCSQRINTGKHKKPEGETVTDRWHNLDSKLRDIFDRVITEEMK